MQYRYTKHQVARGALPSAQTDKKIVLIKRVAMLRLTYQVRLLTFLASEGGKKLVIIVPPYFRPEASLKEFIDEFSKTIKIEVS